MCVVKTLKLTLIFILLTLGNLLFYTVIIDGNSSTSVLGNGIVDFSSNMLITTSDTKYPEHVEPTLAIGNTDQLYVGWKEAQTHISAGVDVSFSTSNDNGLTWTAPTSMPSQISENNSKSDPWLVTYNGEVYYSYLDFSSINSSITQITLAKSTDNGQTWSLSKASKNSAFADKEVFIISPNGTIYIVYDDVSLITNLGVVKLSKSTDGGLTFKEVQITDINNRDILAPYPALSSNQTLFVSWLNIVDSNNALGDVFWDYSLDQGKTFHIDKDLNPETNFATYIGDNTQAGKATIPVMKFDSKDRLYVLWTEFNVKWKVYLRYSDDFGAQWSSKILIHDNPDSSQWLPDMAIDSNDAVHLVWYEEINSQYRPYYRSLTFTGPDRTSMTSSEILAVADSFTSSFFTRPGDYCTMKLDSNGIPHIVWTDGRSGNLDIYYAHGLQPAEQSSSSTNQAPGFTVTTTFIAILVIPVLVRKKIK